MITVLLAAWNGEEFIEEQIDSILKQKFSSEFQNEKIRLVVSDDGSTDRTQEILRKYQKRNPEQVVLKFRDEKRRKKDNEDGIPSAAGNFFWLLSQADDDYIMLSDQDDVWKEHKTERLLQEMKRLEAEYGQEYPILVHSDMEVADEKLQVIHPSFFEYQNCNPNRKEFSELLVENSVTGGAIMMNRALLSLLKERPAACFMHDWWIALTASCFGTIFCVRESLYLYRQHKHNTLGAKESGNVKAAAERLVRSEEVRENYRKMARQAHAFGKMYQNQLSIEQKNTLRAYLALRYQSPIGRLSNILRNRFFKSSKIQTLAQCISIPAADDEGVK